MARPHQFAVRYRIGGEERQTISLSQDHRQIAETLTKIWKCSPAEVEVLDVQWYSGGIIRKR
jgi:hypothetical protein